jgi:GAF domain-containing protein
MIAVRAKARIMDGMVPSGVADVAPWTDWLSAAEAALRFLHGYAGWDVWVVTHVDGDRQIVLRAFPEDVVRPGTELPWARSFCRQMIEGNAPRVATVTAAVPEYASRASGPIRDIAAYVGVPLVTADLELFGTLCGVAFRAKPRSAARELPLVEMTARMLNTLLASDLPGPAARDYAGAVSHLG